MATGGGPDPDRTILIEGISPTTSGDTLELFLESKKNSGGGDFESIQRDGTTAIVTFRDAAVAQRMLNSKRKLILNDRILSVRKPDNRTQSSAKSVVVTGFHLNTSKDAVELLFESSKRSGGGSIEDLTYDEASSTAVITFRENEVAKRVLRRTATLDGAPLTARPASRVDLPDPRTVVISGLTSNISRDIVEMYFESEKRSGGGEIEKCAIDGSIVNITYKDEAVAKRVLANAGNLIINGIRLEVSSSTTHQSQGKPSSHRPRSDGDHPQTRTISAYGFRPNSTRDTVEMFFESSNRSGGGDIENLQFDGTTATITFKNVGVAKRVLSKAGNLELHGMPINVCLPQDRPIEARTPEREFFPRPSTSMNTKSRNAPNDDLEPLAIEVTNVPVKRGQDYLKRFFSNNNKSGGGPIEDIFHDQARHRAVITFKHKSSLLGVISHHQDDPLTIDNNNLTVCQLDPPDDALAPNGIPEPLKYLLTNVPRHVNNNDVNKFLRKATNVQVKNIFYSCDSDTLMVEFKNNPDYSDLERLYKTSPLQGKMITIVQLALPNQIQVFSVSSRADLDDLELYLESEEESGGGPTRSSRMGTTNLSALVVFKEIKAVKRVLQRRHYLNGKELTVRAYYPEFGEIPLGHDPRRPWGQTPDPLDIKIHENYIYSFLKDSRVAGRRLETLTNTLKLKLDWSKSSFQNLHFDYVVDSHGLVGYQQISSHENRIDIEEFLRTITQQRILLMNTVFSNIMDEVKRHQLPDDGIIIQEDKQSTILEISGFLQEYAPHIQKIKDAKENIEHDQRQKETVRTITVALTDIQNELLLTASTVKDIKKQFANVRVDLNRSIFEITGQWKDVLDIENHIKGIIAGIVTIALPVSAPKLKLLQTMKGFIADSFGEQGIPAKLELKQNEAKLHGLEQADIDQARQIIKAHIVESKITIDDNAANFLSDNWNQLKTMLDRQHGNNLSIEYNPANRTIDFACYPSIRNEVHATIKEELEKAVVRVEFVSCHSCCQKLLHLYYHSELKQLEDEWPDHKIDIEPSTDDSNPGFSIKTTQVIMNNVKRSLQSLLNKTVKFDHTLNQPGVYNEMTSSQGKQFLQAQEVTFKVVCQVHDIQTQPPKSTQQIPFTILDTHTVNKCVVKVVKANVLEVSADSIIVPATPHLTGDHSMLVKSVYNAGGAGLKQECQDTMRSKRPVAGNVTHTSGGNTRWKKIIHAVCPEYSYNNVQLEKQLETATYMALKEADKLKCPSVALPLLGTQSFGFSPPDAAKIMHKAVADFLKSNHNVQTIIMFDREEAQAKLIMDKIVMPLKVNNASGGNSTKSKASTASGRYKTGQNKDSIITNEGIMIRQKIGSIVDEKANVMVNSTSHDLKLSRSGVSKMLVERGGPNIQAECSAQCPRGLATGQLLETSAGRLAGVNSIYHVAFEKYDGVDGTGEQMMRKFMNEALDRANNSGCGSIVIPALGTGYLGYPHKRVAKIFFDVFAEFSQRTTNVTLVDICISIYDKDRDSKKAFEAEMQNQVSSKSTGWFPSMPSFSSPFASSSGNSSSKSSTSPNSRTSMTYQLATVTLEVTKGDLMKEIVGAIVNSTNDRLAFHGVLAKTILKQGGQKVEDECKSFVKKHGSVRSVAITGSGNLPCQNIIHINSPSNVNDWKSRAIDALELAETNQLASVAFPGFGTGKAFAVPHDHMASMMFNAVKEFSNRSPRSVRSVKVIIFEASAIGNFLDQMDKEEAGFSYSPTDGGQGYATRKRKLAKTASNHSFGSAGSSRTGQLKISIYAMSQASVDAVTQALDNYYESKLVQHLIDDAYAQEKIKLLTSSQVSTIQQFDRKYNVTIQIERDRLQRIVVHGIPNDVMKCIQEINTILDENRYAKENHSKEQLIAKQVQWEYQGGQSFLKYAPDINSIIEEAYSKKERSATWTEDDGNNIHDYKIDFSNMSEYRLDTPMARVKVRRVDKMEGAIALPFHWEDRSSEKVRIVEITRSGPHWQEYKEVESAFKKTCNGQTIIKIKRIQNPALYKPYILRKKDMEKQNPRGVKNEQLLFHATKKDNVDKINKTNFNRSYGGESFGCWYGKGVYFARDASYSLKYALNMKDSNGHMFMYVANVLTGEFTKGTKDQRAPPPKPGSVYPYDCLVDNEQNPQEFVIFHDNSVYPGHLITFK